MDRSATGSGGGWRRFTASVLAFTLVLQAIAFTWAGAKLPANHAGFELCRHDGRLAPASAPDSPGADNHCIFCLAGATCLGASAAASQFHTVTFAGSSWPLSAWRSPAVTVNASARPRGPPLFA
jgi:hypothetical protein